MHCCHLFDTFAMKSNRFDKEKDADMKESKSKESTEIDKTKDDKSIF